MWLACCATLLVFFVSLYQIPSLATGRDANGTQVSQTSTLDTRFILPSLQVHPLPPALAHWQDRQNQDNYFDQVNPTSVGYLIWSQFPIKVYVEQPPDTTARFRHAQNWTNAVIRAVEEWATYLPIEVVNQLDDADIRVLRSPPPIQAPLQRNFRIRSAETRYEVYLRPIADSFILYHRCTILLRPNQTDQYIQAAARHELGHALGIWGHSPLETDALYFSQVRTPPPISQRDLSTLKRVYEQPTRLGWAARLADS